MRSVVSVVVAVAIGLVLVIAAPSARATFVTAAPDCREAMTTVDANYAYSTLYVEPGASTTYLQFGGNPAVERLVAKNESRLFEAFVALHTPGYAPADLTGPMDGVSTHRLGPQAATGGVILNLTAKPGRGLKVTVPLVCGRDSGGDWGVPLDDLCRALRAAHADQQCSKALLQKAKKGLPRSLAKARNRQPTVVTTPTTVPTTVPTTSPPLTIPPTIPLQPDGYCPYVGRACDDPNIPIPDPDCTCGGSR